MTVYISSEPTGGVEYCSPVSVQFHLCMHLYVACVQCQDTASRDSQKGRPPPIANVLQATHASLMCKRHHHQGI